MHTTCVFTNGNNEVIRLPHEFHCEGGEVVIKKIGDMVILFPKKYKTAHFKEMFAALDPDFLIERAQPATIISLVISKNESEAT